MSESAEVCRRDELNIRAEVPRMGSLMAVPRAWYGLIWVLSLASALSFSPWRRCRLCEPVELASKNDA